jgi:Domain of unknown function (DUF1918)
VKAIKGDRLICRGHRAGQPDRDAEILEVKGNDGSPPYVVRWSDDGRVGTLFPGPDALIHHFEHGLTECQSAPTVESD